MTGVHLDVVVGPEGNYPQVRRRIRIAVRVHEGHEGR